MYASSGDSGEPLHSRRLTTAFIARQSNKHKNHLMAGSYALLMTWVCKTANIFALLGSATYEYMHNEKQNQLLLIKILL